LAAARPSIQDLERPGRLAWKATGRFEGRASHPEPRISVSRDLDGADADLIAEGR
jgi:hypothetical protein